MIGICTKCKQEKNVIMHHEHGYDKEHIQDVKPYCMSCHKKIHIEARKSGRCNINPEELKRLSTASSTRRYSRKNTKILTISDDCLIPYVHLVEYINYNNSTGNISCCTLLRGSCGMKLGYIDCD